MSIMIFDSKGKWIKGDHVGHHSFCASLQLIHEQLPAGEYIVGIAPHMAGTKDLPAYNKWLVEVYAPT